MGAWEIASALMDGKKRRQWLDRQDAKLTDAVRYYGGPAADPVMGIAKLLGAATPGADMMDMAQSSQDLMASRSPMEAAKNAGWLGASTLGMALPGNVGMLREGAEEVAQAAPKGIRAYHGSPHDFDKFSLDKIGTGEGAQAYGHGLYFAENDSVAESYKYSVSGRQAKHTFDGKPVETTQDWWGLEDKLNADGDWRQAKLLKEYAAKIEPDPALRFRQLRDWHRNNPDMMAAIDDLEGRISTDVPKGHMYEVNINANPDDFLDWDKYLNEQTPSVQEALKRRGLRLDDPYNSHAQDIAQRMMDPVNAKSNTQEMVDAGIPGIKYLDQGSRGVGEGSRNYVVFSPEMISILRKYGLLGAIGAGGAAGAGLNQQEPDA
jgi:hypothetical protein